MDEMPSERMLNKRARRRCPLNNQLDQQDNINSNKESEFEKLSTNGISSNNINMSLLQRLTGDDDGQQFKLSIAFKLTNTTRRYFINKREPQKQLLTIKRKRKNLQMSQQKKENRSIWLTTKTTTTTTTTEQRIKAKKSFNSTICLITFGLILFAVSFVAGKRDVVSGSLVAGTIQQSPYQLLAESDKQLQLLRSANVELSRRSERLQRDTPAPPGETSAVASSNGGGGGGQTPTCGYPGSPAHASVTFNTSLVVAGTAASYTCDNGYELLGPPRRLCQANGTWAPVGIPFCVLNVGLGKAAMQSSTAGHGSAQKAVDGSTSPYFQASTCTMTDVEHNPWWYVNLLEPYLVQIVRIDFGTACCANRQKATIAVRVGNNRPDLGNNPLCNRYHGFIEEGKPLFLPCTRPAPGAFVSIHLESPSGSSLSICETFIYTDHALSIEQCPSFRDQPLGSTATYNGKCYLFHNNQALNFDNARKYCESRGGTLVDETSPALQGFLSWELYRRHRNDQLMGQYWLGAIKDTRNLQNWKWINGKDVQISFWNSLGNQGNCSRFDGSKGWLWSDTDCNMNLNFICQYRPLSCGKPEKPTNSTLITKNIDNGTVIEYQCAPGNLLMGPKSRACLPTGFFSEFAPKCKYLDCQFPAMIPNGDYKLLNGTTSYQSIVTYYCNEGYQIYGKATLACDVDERWNGPPPRCEPLLCSAPVPPSNGYVTVTSNITIPGTQATYDCRPGYELVGDRLLTCSQSGSWDNSFPYCREKRPLLPHLPHLGPLTSTTTSTTAATPTQVTGLPRQQQPAVVKPSGSVNSVQFPPPPPLNSPFSSNRIGTSTTTLSPPPLIGATAAVTQSTTPSTSSSASLNGLAGQFVQQSSPTPTVDNSGSQQIDLQQNIRKSAQSNSVSQFVVPPAPAPALAPVQHNLIQPTVDLGQSPQLVSSLPGAHLSTQQPPRFKPISVSPSSSSSLAPPPQQPPSSSSSSSSSSSFSQGNQQQQSFATPTFGSTAPTSPVNRQQQQQQQQTSTAPSNNKFGFIGSSSQQQQPTSTSQVTYDSSPLATTNSISVHHQQPSSISSVPPQSTVSSTIPHTTTTATTMAANPSNHHNLVGSSSDQNVLASFSPPIRSQNTLANARSSLDGIIAVAIFGGFIFLGAIITIMVIIIRRRKSGHSSTIDAQTISTYDSNGGEHNGLYRNYQQAWENLRFATPGSQPKMSGNAAGLITAHINGGPSVGMKNFAAPSMALAAHHAHHMHHGHHQMHGHHNLAMSSSTTSSQSSSLSGTGGTGIGLGGITGVGGVHGHAHHHHQQQQQQPYPSSRRRHSDEHNDDDDDDDDDNLDELEAGEQGVLSSDEANYRADQQAAGEGFRDSNELTINADTVVNGSSQGAAARRRIYSTNSIGRAMAANRLSSNLSMGGGGGGGGHNHHHHHHHHHGHHAHHSSSAGSSQHQRLVSSSTTPSTSTRSSRASPPSDDQSLEQLAYGNSWHPNGINNSNNGGNQSSSQQDSSGHSAGSGASILGNAGRTNMRYN